MQLEYVVNKQRADFYQAQWNRATDPRKRVMRHYDWAVELLRAGETQKAIEGFESLLETAASQDVHLTPTETRAVRMSQVQAFLRLGETQNCCDKHNQDSCLLPLRGDGIYTRPQGPREAVRLLLVQLADVPDDLAARWLLNLAYMMLGEYPAAVPEQWLIPPQAFESDYDINRFVDVAPSVGLDTFGLSGGCVIEDLDGDDDLDIMRSDIAFDGQLRLFRTNGDGTFTDRTKQSGLMGEVGGLNLIHADYNNDGRPDVLVLRGGWFGPEGHFPLSLLRNEGHGRFTDVTEEAHLSIRHPTQTAVWFDYNNDGWLDLFVGTESVTNDRRKCCLYRNERNGTFTECASETGTAVNAFVKGVASGDFNNDGRPDLYISCIGEPNILLRNDGPAAADKAPVNWQFTNVTASAHVASPRFSFPCCWWDYDNDGWEDIFVCGYPSDRGPASAAAAYLQIPSHAETPRLYRNRHDGSFDDVTEAVGLNTPILGMSANFGDLDNDGFLDLYIGTGSPEFAALVPNRMFRNDGGKKFQDVTTSGGFGHLQKGHGIAFADINNDGQQDVYIVMGGAYAGDGYYSLLFANPGHDNRWIKLQLEGVQSNRSAIGARIKVNVVTTAGPRTVYRTVNTGASFGSSPLRQEIGLGQATSIQSVEIFWPTTGKTQIIDALELDRFYKIREGEPRAVAVPLVRFDFPQPTHDSAHHDVLTGDTQRSNRP